MYDDKFQFAHAGTTQLYTMIRQKNLSRPLWACTQDSDNGYHGALYTEQEISDHFAAGDWREISSKEPDERLMVFPLQIKTLDGEYKFYKDEAGAIWLQEIGGTFHSSYPNLYKEPEIAKFIKDGKWRVTSVGEQPKEEPAKPADITITVDTQPIQDAITKAQALAQAVEEVNIALESLHAILSDMGLAVVTKSVAEDCHAFCCEG